MRHRRFEMSGFDSEGSKTGSGNVCLKKTEALLAFIFETSSLCLESSFCMALILFHDVARVGGKCGLSASISTPLYWHSAIF